MPNDVVSAEEILYRSVKPDERLARTVDGRLYVSPSAFNDREGKPSVDRAKLRGSPEESKLGPLDGILVLAAQEVRAIQIPVTNALDDSPKVYSIDIVPRPIPAGEPRGPNPAHAQIEAQPDMPRSRVDRLKEKLALLAAAHGWIVVPDA